MMIIVQKIKNINLNDKVIVDYMMMMMIDRYFYSMNL